MCAIGFGLLGASTASTCSTGSARGTGCTNATSAMEESPRLSAVEVVSIISGKFVVVYLVVLDMECWLLFRLLKIYAALVLEFLTLLNL